MDHVRRPELSRVTLAVDLETDEGRLAKGTSGTVVHVYPQEAAHEVEFNEPIHAIVIVSAEFLQPQTETADSLQARIKAAAEQLGYILDPNDMSLTGGIRVTPADLIQAAQEPPVTCYTITDDMTEDDIFRMLFEDE